MRLILFMLCLVVVPVQAQTQVQTQKANKPSFDQHRAYLGAGLNFNSVGAAGNATGLQIFAGYDLNVLVNNDIRAAVEIGYMDTGNFNNFGFGGSRSAEGVWLAMPFRVAIDKRLDALVRIGVDFGDDDGAMVGAGMGYNFNQRSSFRVEYVVRDNINSFQFNVMFKL